MKSTNILSPGAVVIFFLIMSSIVLGDEPTDLKLKMTPRDISAPSGSAFSRTIESMDLAKREQVILDEIMGGNIPDFLRRLVPVESSIMIEGEQYKLTIFCLPDYLSVGSNDDYFLVPMTPMLAQTVADQMGGILPTRKMVNLIWEAAELQMTPLTIPPSPAMTTVDVFRVHNRMVDETRRKVLKILPLGRLVAGHKKDVILSNRISTQPNKVVIYGWHYPAGKAIQPLYSGHINWYADYSHGIRVVLDTCEVNGVRRDVAEILSDPILFQLLSDEDSPMETTRYDTSRSNYP